jgi:hypothetical protein
VAGQALQQSSASFSNASLSGVVIEYEEGLGSTTNQAAASAGFLTFNGTGLATLSRDDSTAGVTTTQAASLTYSVAANGRVAVQQGGAPFAYLYLVDTNWGSSCRRGIRLPEDFSSRNRQDLFRLPRSVEIISWATSPPRFCLWRP